MPNANLSDTDRHIGCCRTHLHASADYVAKTQEVARLTDVVAKLEARLLDVESENDALRRQLIIEEDEFVLVKMLDTTVSISSEKGHSSPFFAGPSIQMIEPSIKRERSPSLELKDVPQPPSKKAKGKGRKQPNIAITTQPTSHLNEVKVEPSTKPFPKPSLDIRPKDADGFSLPQPVIDEYLQKQVAIEVNSPSLYLEVPRPFIRANYGGNGTRLTTLCSRGKNPSARKTRRMIFADSHLHLHISHPGASGLVIGLSKDVLENSPWTLFCNQHLETPLWRYMGEYQSEIVGQMTASCFISQPYEAKRKWARYLLDLDEGRRFDAYRLMRARIALRLSSFIPLRDKKKERNIIYEEANRIRKNKGMPITENAIIAAFSKGEEHIDIFRMTCIKYDYVFAKDIQTRFAKYDSTHEDNKTGIVDEIEEVDDEDDEEELEVKLEEVEVEVKEAEVEIKEEEVEIKGEEVQESTLQAWTESISEEQNRTNVHALVHTLQTHTTTR